MTSVYDFSYTSLEGTKVDMVDYRDKALLIVNTASECGFTPQYEGLQKLYDGYKERGLVVIGFPCNQFGSQEPGGSEEIGSFCQKRFGVSFPLAEKIEVNGDNAHPLYRFLKSEAPGVLGSQLIKWNFTKFLVAKDGKSISRYASTTTPEDLKADIEALL